ncbi:hypothetical protein OPKNFCMD_3558 [Methylobacterium crusticola]|uniref:Secreted protein n=1 Tax=Methylobacterium crusticola TaxID=1697972 RepID=A0ABQ4R208_9HYPH|nr:hypothetical protein OPKNFCMD_3558 [Methylobacterium crusticola]
MSPPPWMVLALAGFVTVLMTRPSARLYRVIVVPLRLSRTPVPPLPVGSAAKSPQSFVPVISAPKVDAVATFRPLLLKVIR